MSEYDGSSNGKIFVKFVYRTLENGMVRFKKPNAWMTLQLVPSLVCTSNGTP